MVHLGFVPTEGEDTRISYVVFAFMIGGAWAVDFYVNASGTHKISVKSAFGWTLIWALVSVAFAGYLKVAHPNQPTWYELFLAGYLLELALSVDNLVIFIIVFKHFGINDGNAQHRLLLYGIFGCIFTRIGFASLGEGALEGAYEPFLDLALSGLMFYLGVSMMVKEEEDEEEETNYDDMILVKIVKKCLKFYPNSKSNKHLTVTADEIKEYLKETPNEEAQKQLEEGTTRWATPGLFCLCALLGVDLMFSFDSAGAILAITHEPLIIISSMLCGVMGLRSLFHLIQALSAYFQHLQAAISATLCVIGLQLLISTFEGFKEWVAPSWMGSKFEAAVHKIGFEIPWWHDKTEAERSAILFVCILSCLTFGFAISYFLHKNSSDEGADSADKEARKNLLTQDEDAPEQQVMA